MPIDIETLEGCRKRNYAALAAQAYMSECNDRGLRPYWVAIRITSVRSV